MKPSNYLALRGRTALQAVRRLGKAVLGLPSTSPTVRSSVADFTPFIWGGRRMTPDQVKWIIEGAVGGNLSQQWDLFDMMEDSWPRLVKNLNELKRAASRVTLNVQAYARKGEEPSESADERAAAVDAALRNWRPRPGTLELSLEDALYDALDSFGKGTSVLEVTWQRIPDGLLPRCAHFLHPRRYGWNAAGNELGLIHAADAGTEYATWSPFAPGQFWVGIRRSRSGAPGQTALLRCLAPYWCGVTFGWEWLLNNAQIFGVPLRWATYDASRADLLPQLEQMLANLGQAGWAAFPEGTKMEFKEAVTRGADNPQVLIQTYADKACDLLILGQEASSESKPAGLGNGASELHGSVRADRLQDAAQWCADLLNYQLVPAVLRFNFGDEAEPPTIVPDVAGEPDPKAKADRDQILAQIAPLPAKWFYERHGIPAPEADEETVGGQPPASPFDFPAPAGSSGMLKPAPGGEGSPESGSGKSPRIDDLDPARGETAPRGLEARRINSPRFAVALHASKAMRGSVRRAVLPGTYQMSDETRRALLAAQARDLEPLRRVGQPILAAIEAGNLDLIGQIETFIAQLDQLGPTVAGSTELADALEAALTEAAISGAVQAYGKLPTSDRIPRAVTITEAKPAMPPAGTYRGTWSGYEIRIEQPQPWTLRADIGNRGTIEVAITVNADGTVNLLS